MVEADRPLTPVVVLERMLGSTQLIFNKETAIECTVIRISGTEPLRCPEGTLSTTQPILTAVTLCALYQLLKNISCSFGKYRFQIKSNGGA